MKNLNKTVAEDPLAVALKNGQLYVRLASFITFLSGVFLLLQPILHHTHSRLERDFLPPKLQSTADFSTLILGLLLIYLAYELTKRKRIAWYIALATSIVSSIYEIHFTPDSSRDLFPILAIAILLIGHRQFVLKTNHVTNLRQGFTGLAISAAIALFYGTIGFWLLDKRDFGINFTLNEAFSDTLKQYLSLGNADLITHTRYSKWFLDSLSIVGLTTLAYSIYSILQPLRYEYSTLPAERENARRLLEQYGGETDDYFKLWPEDKSYFFSDNQQAFIAYAVSHGVAVCLADPEGKPESIPGVIQEFRDFCTGNGWLIAFIAASDKHKAVYENSGFSSLLIGADAIVDINKFMIETSRNKYFRNLINRFNKSNITTTRHLPPHTPELINELRYVSNDWLKIPNHKQWAFITGYFSSKYFSNTPLFVARDEDGKALAFANEIPSFKKGEATIDLMRHKRTAPKNVMDYLFIDLMRQLQETGVERFNLGLSPLARQGFVDNFSEKLLDYIYLISQRFVSTKGLHQYKAKFDPEWQPRYVYYLGSTPSLPQIGLALSKLSIYK